MNRFTLLKNVTKGNKLLPKQDLFPVVMDSIVDQHKMLRNPANRFKWKSLFLVLEKVESFHYRNVNPSGVIAQTWITATDDSLKKQLDGIIASFQGTGQAAFPNQLRSSVSDVCRHILHASMCLDLLRTEVRLLVCLLCM